MNLPLFIARKIYADSSNQRQVSGPAIRIATIGVAIGLTVMIITVSVVLGFKNTIRDKVVGFGSHIQIENFATQQMGIPAPVCISDSLLRQLKAVPGVSHVSRYTQVHGILKTDSDFLGVALKGIDKSADLTFLRQNLTEGKLPDLGGKKYEVLISRLMADKLHLKTGDKIYAYFIAYDHVRARKFSISGIYQTDLKQYDELLCFTAYSIPQRLNEWESNQCSGAELLVDDFDRVEETAELVAAAVNQNVDEYGETLTSQTIYEACPQIFSWLSLLDINVWIILILMVCVAGFTMISGLLIIILERTQMIGLLKALGARNGAVRHTFLWFAVFIIGRGMLFGNFIGIGLVLLQKYTGLVRLDPANYYVDTTPVEINLVMVLALNAATLLASFFVLIAPSHLVSHIHPARSMKYE